MQTARLMITGMDHEGCADTLNDILQAIDGVDTVCVSLARSDATVQFDESVASRERLLDAVQQAGYLGEMSLGQPGIPCTGACGHCPRS